MTTDELAGVLRGFRFTYADEDLLQRAIADALEAAGVHAEREVRLDGAGRIDFLSDAGIGIEVKVAGPVRSLAAQVTRYLHHERLTGLVVVTDRVRHLRLPFEVDEKPLRVVCLAGHGL